MPDWKLIYDRHSTAVWRTAWRILRDSHLAADCVQETFLAAMKNPRVQIVREWEALLVSIATRRALDQLRVRCRLKHRQSSIDLLEIRSSTPAPDQNSLSAELGDRLRGAVAELPPQQAEVFCLRVFDELSYHEIAIQLDLEEGHVGVLLHRARQCLQRQLSDVNHLISEENVHD